ncbi:MAG TPA: DUF1570 domain-containing protein [Kofleriaceae bacterium]|nr:DUF1570 domain-containing protein [Kofleriaceae bacterium]
MKWVVAVWCVVALSCGARLPPLPSQGGPAWIELSSPHFKMWTDGSPEHGRELLQQMEHFRSIIYGVAFPDLPPGGVAFVVAFVDRREAQVYTAYMTDAFSDDAVRSPIDQPTIVLPAELDAGYVAQQIAFATAHSAMRHTPWWLTTGFGMYFKTIDLDVTRGTARVGTPDYRVRRQLEHHRVLPTAKLFTCTHKTCAGDSFNYASAWALYAFLLNNHPAELRKLEHQLESQKFDAAWQTSFGDLTLDQVDKQVLDWLGSGGIAVASYKLELQQWPTQQRSLGDADVHALRALLHFYRDRDDSRHETAAAIALDPSNVLARIVESDLDKQPPAIDVAKALVAAHPDQWLAWGLLYAALKQGPDADAAHAKMCELVLQNPELLLYEKCKSASQPTPAP